MANPPPHQVPSAATAIINPQYCVPHPVDLIITKGNILSEYFKVKDTNGNVVFTVENPLVTFVTPRNHRFVRDAHGNPVVHLRRSLTDGSWKAFRGESTEPRDLIFTRRRSSPFQLTANSNVFLANNNNTTEICDFKVKSSFFGESSVVYIGESDTVAAQIRKELGPIIFKTQKVTVTVSPNIDYAFIVALVMTLDY